MHRSSLFSFPHPVNEVSARIVAAGALLMAIVALVLQQHWVLVPLGYGFVARVLTGPTLSPLGQVSTRLITPRLAVDPRYVAGPPKRFAQGVGAVLAVSAVLAQFGFGATTLTNVLLGMIIVAATLESVFAICLGCRIFAVLMRARIIPAEVCLDCADIWARRARISS